MAQTVIGFFDNTTEAQDAVEKLTSRGFSRSDIDVSSAGADTTSSLATSDTNEEESGISRFFKNLFSDDDESSSKYTSVASRSQCIVTVHAQSADEAEDAADILDDCGAVNVDERAASYGYGTSGSTTESLSGNNSGSLGGSLAGSTTEESLTGSNTMSNTFPDTSATSFTASANSDYSSTNSSNDDTTKIPIIEENLEVGKREVLRGGVRLRSRIIERPVEESVRLREESVRVERTPVDRAASASDLANFKETEIEMTERAEVPVITKEARVVEEVSLGKEVSERTETVSDTVRKTQVDVEDIDRTTNTGTTSTDFTTDTNAGTRNYGI